MNVAISVIYLLCAGQGLLLVAVLAGRKDNYLSNRVLAILLGLFSLHLINLSLRELGVSEPLLYTRAFSFIYGPLLYLYVMTLTTRIGEDYRPVQLLHFTPFLIAQFIVPFLPASIDSALRFPIIGAELIQYITYLTLSLTALISYERGIQSFYSEIERLTLKWLKIVITVDYASLIVLAGCFTAHVAGLIDLHKNPLVSRVSFLLSSFCIYVIGYFAMKQQDITPLALDMNNSINEPVIEPLTVPETNDKTDAVKYEKSKLDDSIIEAYCRELTAHMEKVKPYKNSSLTVNDLADPLSLTYHTLSQVINSGFGMNFYTYINSYRIEEVKRMLADPKMRDENILTIAYEAGFKNKSNFNTIFKQKTGLTPSEYRRKLLSLPSSS